MQGSVLQLQALRISAPDSAYRTPCAETAAPLSPCRARCGDAVPPTEVPAVAPRPLQRSILSWKHKLNRQVRRQRITTSLQPGARADNPLFARHTARSGPPPVAARAFARACRASEQNPPGAGAFARGGGVEQPGHRGEQSTSYRASKRDRQVEPCRRVVSGDEPSRRCAIAPHVRPASACAPGGTKRTVSERPWRAHCAKRRGACERAVAIRGELWQLAARRASLCERRPAEWWWWSVRCHARLGADDGHVQLPSARRIHVPPTVRLRARWPRLWRRQEDAALERCRGAAIRLVVWRSI